jgi:hypothetical protein
MKAPSDAVGALARPAGGGSGWIATLQVIQLNEFD